MAVSTYRRYAFIKEKCTDEGISSAWKSIRLNAPSTPYPPGFPHASFLIDADYLVLEEVADANEDELTKAGLTTNQATDVIAFLEV